MGVVQSIPCIFLVSSSCAHTASEALTASWEQWCSFLPETNLLDNGQSQLTTFVAQPFIIQRVNYFYCRTSTMVAVLFLLVVLNKLSTFQLVHLFSPTWNMVINQIVQTLILFWARTSFNVDLFLVSLEICRPGFGR